MVDWSQAPEGATHKAGEFGLWYKLNFIDDTASYWTGSKWGNSGTASSYNDGSLDDMTVRPIPTLETMLTEWRDLTARAQAAQAEADALFEHAGQCHGEICVRLAELGWGAPRVAAVVSEPMLDMSDVNNWTVGDVVEVVTDDAGHGWKLGTRVTVIGVDIEDTGLCVDAVDKTGDSNWMSNTDARWISRPSAQQ